MMNRCAYQQQNNNINNNALVRGGEMMNGVVCPKPRRLCLLNPSIKESVIAASSPRCQHHYPIHQTEMCESKARTELLDMILTKECYGVEKSNNLIPSSPPFFCGSPPSRASNPVVQDAQFGNENPSPLSPACETSPSPSPRKNGGSCARGKFGQKHPAVRVEGFNCRGISAVA
ncbi:uncharacterized protein LOC112525103 [Cynara cardunculus var. scolymus]|uniref:Uncharacterized protein n=1 Tax=Cynara cardunculus var. scolymus TaxID=59895 RepID=A0A124SFV8_CYNCS|nr:uncharacterized protein LOC112525103 [Cynara cardunculus var. scolymus]KVI04483.1 hypothetical protein Ccrd_017200 [Cynara cardunculus var. scolymus]